MFNTGFDKTIELVLEHIRAKKTLLIIYILSRETNYIGNIPKRNLLFHDAIEGQITEVQGVGRRRRTQLLDDLRNKRIYWELKEENMETTVNKPNMRMKHKLYFIIP